MAYSFAAQVSAQLACYRHRLAADHAAGDETAEPALTAAHYETLAAALTEDRFGAWLDGVRALGACVADQQGDVEGLIGEALAFCRRLRECLVEDMPGGHPDDPRLARDLQGLETSMLTALV